MSIIPTILPSLSRSNLSKIGCHSSTIIVELEPSDIEVIVYVLQKQLHHNPYCKTCFWFFWIDFEHGVSSKLERWSLSSTHHPHHPSPWHHHHPYQQDNINLEMALVRALLMASWVSGDENDDSPESVIFRHRLGKVTLTVIAIALLSFIAQSWKLPSINTLRTENDIWSLI